MALRAKDDGRSCRITCVTAPLVSSVGVDVDSSQQAIIDYPAVHNVE